MMYTPSVPTISRPLREAAAASVARQSHVPGVDGLRCFAVLAVMLFHVGMSKTGWAGVWLFFVISGFVITRSLMANAALGLPAKELFRRFYLKRSFRILPLYLGSISVFTLVILSFASERGEKLDHLPWLLTFTYNFYRLDSDYVPNDFFGHFWSLSVEEQFYFVYPALLVLLGIARLRYALIAALVAAPLIRLMVSLIYGAITPEELDVNRAFWRGNAVYQFGLTQFDAFAIGALIALNERRIRASDHAFPAVASVALVGFPCEHRRTLCASLALFGPRPLGGSTPYRRLDGMQAGLMALHQENSSISRAHFVRHLCLPPAHNRRDR